MSRFNCKVKNSIIEYFDIILSGEMVSVILITSFNNGNKIIRNQFYLPKKTENG